MRRRVARRRGALEQSAAGRSLGQFNYRGVRSVRRGTRHVDSVGLEKAIGSGDAERESTLGISHDEGSCRAVRTHCLTRASGRLVGCQARCWGNCGRTGGVAKRAAEWDAVQTARVTRAPRAGRLATLTWWSCGATEVGQRKGFEI